MDIYDKDRQVAVDAFAAAAEGALDWVPKEDDPDRLLTEYHATPGLTQDPHCVHVAFLDGRPCGLLVAQAADNGWATLTWMGVARAFRGKGISKWVQRQGMDVMRRFGGTVYPRGNGRTERSNDCDLPA